MKKLSKQLLTEKRTVEATVQAMACPCSCGIVGCSCRTNERLNQSNSDYYQKQYKNGMVNAAW